MRIGTVIVFLSFSLLMLIVAYAQAPAPQQLQQGQGIDPPPQAQAAIDSAWKDMELAQLRLQLVVTQVLAQMDRKDVVYDFQQRKFVARPKDAKAPQQLPQPQK